VPLHPILILVVTNYGLSSEKPFHSSTTINIINIHISKMDTVHLFLPTWSRFQTRCGWNL